MAVDLKKLRALSESSPTAKRLFQYFASRERERGEALNLTRLRILLNEMKGPNIDDKDYYRVFGEMQRLGLGQAIKGQRVPYTGFILKYTVSSIAQVAKGKGDLIERVSSAKVIPEPDAPPPEVIRDSRLEQQARMRPITNTTKLAVTLDDSRMAILDIPIDLTETDISKIKTALERLF